MLRYPPRKRDSVGYLSFVVGSAFGQKVGVSGQPFLLFGRYGHSLGTAFHCERNQSAKVRKVNFTVDNGCRSITLSWKGRI